MVLELFLSLAAAQMPVNDIGPDSDRFTRDTAEVEECTQWIRNQTPPELNQAVSLRVSDQTFCFDGDIMQWTVEDVRSWLEAAERSTAPINLVVRSKGGDASVGIEIAEKLKSLAAKVTVVDYCMSSCANYFYAAIPDRNIYGTAAILFHGGYDPFIGRTNYVASVSQAKLNPALSIADPDAWEQRQIARYDEFTRRQEELYRGAGVALAVVTGLGAVEPDAIPAERCGLRPDAPRSMLFFTNAQAEYLGLTPVTGAAADDPVSVDAILAQFSMEFTACEAPLIVLTDRKNKGPSDASL